MEDLEICYSEKKGRYVKIKKEIKNSGEVYYFLI